MHRDVVAAVEDEAAQLRRGGAAGLDEELDAAFRRVTPPGAAREGPDEVPAVLAQLRAARFVDVAAPVAGGGAGASAKRLVRRAIAFNLRHLAAQLGAVNERVVTALELLDARVRELEGAATADAPSVDVSGAAGTVADLLAGASGLVVHAVATAAAVAGVESRAVTHAAMAQLADGSVGAAVVPGWAEHGSGRRVTELADRVARVLAPGGRVVVVGVVPDQWGSVVSPLVADLGPARPLHAETWVDLFRQRGLADPDVRRTGPLYVLAAGR